VKRQARSSKAATIQGQAVGLPGTARALSLAVLAAALLLALLAGSASGAYTAGTPLTTNKLTSSVAVNQASRDLYVASYGGTGALPGFEAGGFARFSSAGAEIPCILEPSLEHPAGVAVNPVGGNLTVIGGEASTSNVYAFAPTCGPQLAPPFSIPTGGGATPLPQPAADSAGNRYIPFSSTSPRKVMKFDSSGTEVPLANPIEGLSNPSSVALDAAGNLYVTDPASAGLNEQQTFSHSGMTNEVTTFTLGNLPVDCTNPTTSAITFASNNTTRKNRIQAALEAQCGPNFSVTAVASNVINFQGKYAAQDVPLLTCSADGGTCSVVTSRAAVPSSVGRLLKYAPDGTALGTVLGNGVSTVAVDKTTGEIFAGVGRGPTFHVEKYSAGGTKLADFGLGQLIANPSGVLGVHNQLAVDETSGTVYVADGGSFKVQVFNVVAKPKLQLKTEKIGTGLGTVTSDRGEPTAINCGPTCEAEFEEESFVTLTASAESGSTFVKWENCTETGPQASTGLGANQCRVKMTTAKTAQAEFTLPGNKLTVLRSGSGSGSVTSVPAGINCGSECENVFDVGEVVKLTPLADSGSAFKEWSGCDAVVETNKCEVTMNATKTVTAAFVAAPAVVTTAGATNITPKKADVAGTVNPNGSNVTDCEVEYGPTISYGSKADCASLPGSGSSPVPVSASLSGLDSNATYHFRFVAINQGGTGEGGDQTFTTAPLLAPAVVTQAATGTVKTTTTLNGTVNPQLDEVTDCHFEYGPTVAYGSSAPCVPANPGAGSLPVGVSASISGLSADTEYHFRLFATNGGGTTAGDDLTFETAADEKPAVTSLSPSQGPTAGGTSVTITGTNLTGASAVKFGATNATGFTVDSPTQITATAPAGSAGTVDVTVTTAGGSSANTSADDYTYVAAPTTTGCAPSQGPTAGGTSVTITGTNLTGASAVKFGATHATGFTVDSPTQITATAPAGSAGTVDVTVTTAGGSSATGAGDQYSYVIAPTVVTTGGATEATSSTAKVAGMVNPNGSLVTSCKIEYGTTASYGEEKACSPPPGSGSGPIVVSASLTGLAVNQTYHFRLVATNAGGTTNGNDRTFSTQVKLPAVVTGAATGITQATATVAGAINPNSTNVTGCRVEYGTTTSYGSQVSCASPPGSGSSPVNVSALLSGLSASATYHFRVVASNAGGTTNGLDQAFTTLANPPAEPAPIPVPNNRAKPGSAESQGLNVALRVTVPGPGTLSATAKKMAKAKGTAKAAGPVKLMLKLTSAGKKELKKKGRLKVKVKIVYTPTGGSPGTTTKTVTFKVKGKK
jgi:hypothetical protein